MSNSQDFSNLRTAGRSEFSAVFPLFIRWFSTVYPLEIRRVFHRKNGPNPQKFHGFFAPFAQVFHT
jgi:hypothetical protein